MKCVSLITCTGVYSAQFSNVTWAIKRRYPDARLMPSHEPGTVLVAIPDLNWTIGHASFFADLRRSGMIGGFAQKSYSDWDMEVMR